MKSLNFPVILVWGTLAAWPIGGLAKEIDTYSVAVKVENAAGGSVDLAGGFGSLFGAGFTCTAYLQVSENESIPGADGSDREISFGRKSDFAFTMMGQPQATTELPVNFKNKNAHMSIDLHQDCTTHVPDTCYNYESDGRGGTRRASYSCTKTVYMPMQWNCSVPAAQLPRNGAKRQLTCQPNNQMSWLNFFSAPMASMIMNYLQKKVITADIAHLGQRQHFMNYNCPGDVDVSHLDPNLQQLFHFAGGIKNSVITRSTKFDITVNGKPAVSRTRDDGLTNFDLLYCKSSPDEVVDIGVTAKNSAGDFGTQHVSFDKDARMMQSMDFGKKGMLWGKWNSNVFVSPVETTGSGRGGYTGAY